MKLSRRKKQTLTGFTLVELLAVIALVSVLFALSVPALTSLQNNLGYTNATSAIEDLLKQARSQAMAHNTYVYVGFQEVDASQSLPGPDQTAATGIGRVVVGIFYSNDGTSGYESSATGPSIWSDYADGAGFTPLTKLHMFENLHLADLGTPPASGEMARPFVGESYRIGNAACVSTTPFAWPLGKPLDKGQYNFATVIQFDPSGSARIVLNNNGNALPKEIEVGLQPTHGNVLASSSNFRNQRAIQINGVNGTTRIYRP